METRGIKDLYLPKGWALHVKIGLFCAVFTPLWGLFIEVDLRAFYLLHTFWMMVVNIEIMMFLSSRIFKFSGNYPTPKAVTRAYLSRLAVFVVSGILLCSLTFTLFLLGTHWYSGWGAEPFSAAMFLDVLGASKAVAIAFVVVSPVFFFSPWQQAMKREFELREQNLMFQNETLKNQVNPHFLFNSLNTLSSLVSAHTEIAELFIGRLSSIYRYILENSPKDKVPLQAELSFLNDYFFLHKIRDEEKIQLKVDVPDVASYQILPVSLQLLLENAIKHNMATRERPLKIDVYLEDSYIVMKNNIQKMATKLPSPQTGLKNLRNRVRLVTGKELIVEDSADTYIVKIPLIK